MVLALAQGCSGLGTDPKQAPLAGRHRSPMPPGPLTPAHQLIYHTAEAPVPMTQDSALSAFAQLSPALPQFVAKKKKFRLFCQHV